MAKKVELKTKQNDASVSKFLNSIQDEEMRKDCKVLDKIMREVSGCKPKMWGSSIVGYDTYDYKYASGREGTWMIIGFSPRKTGLSVYLMPGYDLLKEDLDKLGPHKHGKSCLNIKRLSDIKLPVLKRMIKKDYQAMKKKYPN